MVLKIYIWLHECPVSQAFPGASNFLFHFKIWVFAKINKSRHAVPVQNFIDLFLVLKGKRLINMRMSELFGNNMQKSRSSIKIPPKLA